MGGQPKPIGDSIGLLFGCMTRPLCREEKDYSKWADARLRELLVAVTTEEGLAQFSEVLHALPIQHLVSHSRTIALQASVAGGIHRGADCHVV